MSIGPKLRLGQRQRIGLTPTLARSLSILAMPMPDLFREVEREAAENPLLVFDAPSHLTLEYSDSAVAAPVSLRDTLLRQISVMSLPADVERAAIYLTGDLNEDGYLLATEEELMQELSLGAAAINAAIEALQSCEPAGIGARTLGECLKLQLLDRGISGELATIVETHLPLFANQDWRALSRETGKAEDELRVIADTLMTLDPHPAGRFEAEPETIQPDVVIRNSGGGFVVELHRSAMPDVEIDSKLLAAAMSDETATGFTQQYRKRAEGLLQAIRYRGESLLRITNEILRIQHQFFAGEVDTLCPLTRRDIAENTSLHPSTAGRVISGKYLEFEGQVYPLSHFMTRALGTVDGGVISSFSAQRRIADLIRAENPEEPLSDDQIAAQLCADGVDIARRTVAKYRGCMNIPTSFRRRQISRAKMARSR